MNIQDVLLLARGGKPFRRKSWTHGDFLHIKNPDGYGGGELCWKACDNRAQLFYVDDLAANDWFLEGEKKRTTLRIMKHYFDRILSGEKRVEYRSKNTFYDKVFAIPPDEILFHYQGERRIVVPVEKIEIIPCPERLKQNPRIQFSDTVYAIHLAVDRIEQA